MRSAAAAAGRTVGAGFRAAVIAAGSVTLRARAVAADDYINSSRRRQRIYAADITAVTAYRAVVAALRAPCFEKVCARRQILILHVAGCVRRTGI